MMNIAGRSPVIRYLQYKDSHGVPRIREGAPLSMLGRHTPRF